MAQCTVPPASETSERLCWLADREFERVSTVTSTLLAKASAGLILEACRCLDHANVIQTLAPTGRGQLAYPDLDLIQRGWNSLLGLLLPRAGGFSGVPLRESTPQLREAVLGMLHTAGRSVILRKASEMVRYNLVAAATEGEDITLCLSEGTEADFFHDQADQQRLANLSDKMLREYRPADSAEIVKALRVDMAKLVFPWSTPHGLMVGYGAEPHIDDYFLHAVSENALHWSDEAGIHPEAELDGVSGAALRAVVLVLMSFYLKHIMFVEEGVKKFAGVNPYMSLTIWKEPASVCQSVVAATGMPESMARAAIDFLTVRPSDGAYFLGAATPWIPMLIEISEGYLLSPISSIFRNPFHGIRMFREHDSPAIRHSLAKPREQWMASELYALFQGPRFDRIPRPVRLRKGGALVTDIDAAIYDRLTDELVVFQLKWQDFSTSDLRIQRSKAKNFRDQVGKWAARTRGWAEEFGMPRLLRTLKIKAVGDGAQTTLRLIALGRSNARFRSYGYELRIPGLMCMPWPQLVRLRYDIGPVTDFFSELEVRVQREARAAIPRSPIPHTLDLGDCKITFADIWSEFVEPAANDQGPINS